METENIPGAGIQHTGMWALNISPLLTRTVSREQILIYNDDLTLEKKTNNKLKDNISYIKYTVVIEPVLMRHSVQDYLADKVQGTGNILIITNYIYRLQLG